MRKLRQRFTEVMKTIAKCKMRVFIAQQVGFIYVERRQDETKNQIGDTLVDVLQFGNDVASNEIKTASI